eukprot:scaffold1655_cov89-Skeletonema_dohrnii-CCMP3373.AAC.5
MSMSSISSLLSLTPHSSVVCRSRLGCIAANRPPGPGLGRRQWAVTVDEHLIRCSSYTYSVGGAADVCGEEESID